MAGIKLSLDLQDDVEQTKDLIAVHNIPENKLAEVLKLQGLPMPSIAVTKANIGWDKFGEYSMIFNKGTIAPEANRRNKVYGADAWTPVFPSIDYDVDEDRRGEITRALAGRMRGKIPQYLIQKMERFNDTGMGRPERNGIGGIVDSAMNNPGMKAVYLADQGITVKDIVNTVKVPSMESLKAGRAKVMVDAFGDTVDLWRTMPVEDVKDKYGAEMARVYRRFAVQNGIKEDIAEKRANALQNKTGITARRFLSDVIADAVKYKTEGISYTEEQRRDSAGIESGINRQIDNDKYRKWLEDKYQDVVIGSGLWNGKERLTSSGSRRSFKQTHIPVTTENIVKSMLASAEDVRNTEGFNGIKSVRAVVVPEFRNTDEIRKAKGKLSEIDNEAYKALYDKLDTELISVVGAIADRTGSNDLMRYDHVGNVILEAGRTRNFNEQTVAKTFRQYDYYKPTIEEIERIADILRQIREMPVNMFEAKPQRVVDFSEVVTVLAPKDGAPELKEALHSAGMTTLEYDPEVEGDRLKKLQSVENARFSLTISEDGETLYDKNGKEIPVKYTYNGLISKPPVKIESPSEYGFDIIQYRKDLTRNEVADAIFNNIEAYNKVNKTGLGRKALRNKEIGTVQVKVGAIKHGLIRMGSVNYAAYESLPMIINNAIVVNEADGMRNDADKAYIMFGAFTDGQNIHVARLVVNHYDTGNELENVEALYSFRAKKEGVALNGAPSRQITASGSPSFTVSIAELLNGVKEDYPDMLPEDVLSRFGLERSGKEDIETLRYQLDISEEDMPREDLLAENAELRRANEYLTGMLNSYKDLTPSEKDIHKVVKGLADEFGYNGDLKPVEEKVGKFYTYLRTAEGIDGKEVTQVAAALANEIVDKAEHIDPELEKVWKDFRKTMRSTRIYIPESNIADYAPDGWNDFRKEWFGRIIFTKSKEYSNGVYDGAAVYRRLQEQFSDYFTAPADGMTDDEAIHHIMEAFDLQKPMAEPAYRGADKDEVALILGQRILEAYASVGNQDVRAQYNKSYKEFARQTENRIRKEYIKALEEQRIENAGELKKLKRRFDASEIGSEAYVVGKRALLDYEQQTKQAAARQWRKSREEYEDSRKKSAYKKEIIRNTEKLTRMINQPTDKAHVPLFMLSMPRVSGGDPL